MKVYVYMYVCVESVKEGEESEGEEEEVVVAVETVMPPIDHRSAAGPSRSSSEKSVPVEQRSVGPKSATSLLRTLSEGDPAGSRTPPSGTFPVVASTSTPTRKLSGAGDRTRGILSVVL